MQVETRKVDIDIHFSLFTEKNVDVEWKIPDILAE